MADRAQDTTILGAQFFRRPGGDKNPGQQIHRRLFPLLAYPCHSHRTLFILRLPYSAASILQE